ncbi:kinase D-interacting substrate of 220 kDa B [Nilaparvata lugens]|uniref:kinase D-interacting substrate of 220 kDa B n=1 Tax=Nilaparvata lugens TaxID=108931 RepID=UPI00193CA2FB|nr:kinase D-interacting substrate of 220 kDa B [Nilaparvata lugens]
MDEESEEACHTKRRRASRGMSLLHLHMPQVGLVTWSSWYPSTPSVVVTGPQGGGGVGGGGGGTMTSSRKFSFASLRRLSTSTLNRSDSMVSLCYRALFNYIQDDNIIGLQTYLENKRVLVDDRDENGITALQFAALKGKLAICRELLNHGADVNLEDNDNWTALLCAAKEGHTEICEELLNHGANIEQRDMGGWSSLMWATYKGHTSTVRLLLDRSADVNAHGNYHISSLLWAAGRGHTHICRMLVKRGAKVNVGDKYGTTALTWACRKGNPEIVECLLKAGANVDTAGMYSWTPLLVAAMGNHVEVVNQLLEYRPNINALDKDGCTALTIVCKEGFHDIAVALLNSGAYINIQDRSGDTNLIHAVKGGHRSVVEALLKKYADVDIPGKERKTATYTAVEKGNIPILKLLLGANPDLEIATKDGDTPLLRAVRSRNTEAVQLLLEKKAKVSACDRRGDTALHVAMRARSKAIVEVLLRHPKNSQLLYRPNRAGETPYNIDMNNQKTILGQIFGARRLNTNEDNENLLGYDLYSSALADILSEPSLSMPITVGLYAKWGSGKSFLLNKLREEMKNFARQWVDPTFQFSWLLLVLLAHFVLIVGVIVTLIVGNWMIGLVVTSAIFLLIYAFLVVIGFGSQRYNWDWPYNLNVYLTQKMNAIRVVLQVMFCHPPGKQWSDSLTAQPIRFYFTDLTRVSSTTAGENSVVQMIGSLYDSIENDYGALSTRLYRAFQPKPLKSTANWRWRKQCCLPNVVMFELCFLCALVALFVLAVYTVDLRYPDIVSPDDRLTGEVVLVSCGAVVVLCFVANIYTVGRLLGSLVFSQRRQLQRAISRLDTLKSEGFLQALRAEVSLMTEMVKCLDAFTQQQTRLVIVVDGLDSCEQDKVLIVLDAIHVLFSDANTPFIIILAIDPHIISKAVELNSKRLLTESNIGGHDYLRNMVHLPFYLQNSALRKVKVAQKSAHHRKSVTTQPPYESSEGAPSTSGLAPSASNRRLSTESGLSSQEKLKLPNLSVARKGSRKLKLSESIASSMGSNLNRAGGAHDLTKMLLTDDYFSDVNPRSMRRLMNVVYITGITMFMTHETETASNRRLSTESGLSSQEKLKLPNLSVARKGSRKLKLSESIASSMGSNLNRAGGAHDLTKMLLTDDYFSDCYRLYDKVRPQIPMSKEVEPLLELDRDERKFDIFLSYHRSSLLVSDLRVFLPFTINLDPYIKKVIKEDQQNLEEAGLMSPFGAASAGGAGAPPGNPWQQPPLAAPGESSLWNRKVGALRRQKSLQRHQANAHAQHNQAPHIYATNPWHQQVIAPSPVVPSWPAEVVQQSRPLHYFPMAPAIALPPHLFESRLSELNVDGVCDLMLKIEDLPKHNAHKYFQIVKSNNISGRVLLYCDMEDLKKVLNSLKTQNIGISQTDKSERVVTKQSVMEKQYQVTLEEQMICGALQTLNEEACEDVLEESSSTADVAGVGETPSGGPASLLVLPEPEPLNLDQVIFDITSENCEQGRHRHRTSSQGSCISLAEQNETDVLILQHSPLHPTSWTAAPYESQSDSSSVAEDTPVLPRRQKPGDSKTPAANPRPSSLLVAIPGEDDSSAQHSPALRSLSADDGKTTSTKQSVSLLASFLVSKNVTSVAAPCVTVTPACSLEALARMRNNYRQQEQSSDDESTPLVSEMSSPTTTSALTTPTTTTSSQQPATANGETNRGFGGGASAIVASPTSLRSSNDRTSSNESISKVLESCEELYNNLSLVESPTGDQQHYTMSPRLHAALPRQNAVETDDDATKCTWNDPETTV